MGKNAYAEHGPYDMDFSGVGTSRPAPMPYDEDPYSEDFTNPSVPSSSEQALESNQPNPSYSGPERPAARSRGRGRGAGRERQEGRGRGRGRGRGNNRPRGDFDRQPSHQDMSGSQNPSQDPYAMPMPIGSFQGQQQHYQQPALHQQQQQFHGSNFMPQQPYQHSIPNPQNGQWFQPPMQQHQQQQYPPQFGTQPYQQPFVQPHINPRFASAFGMSMDYNHSQNQFQQPYQQQHHQADAFQPSSSYSVGGTGASWDMGTGPPEHKDHEG